MKIPEKFYKGDNHPKANTVGALKKILDELPNGMRIECGFGEGVEVVVYNHGTETEHLEFRELEGN
jgi:hypothetical protein